MINHEMSKLVFFGHKSYSGSGLYLFLKGTVIDLFRSKHTTFLIFNNFNTFINPHEVGKVEKSNNERAKKAIE